MTARSQKMRLLVLALLTTLQLPGSVRAMDFAHDVMPILKTHCGKCHTGQQKEGGLSMNTRAELMAGGESGKAVIVGKFAESLFAQRIRSDDEDEWMPPEGPRVPPEQIAILEKWINAGLTWDEGVTLGLSSWQPPLKPRHVQLPPPCNGRDHPIDRLLDADLAEHQRTTPPPITDAAFFRRASLDAAISSRNQCCGPWTLRIGYCNRGKNMPSI